MAAADIKIEKPKARLPRYDEDPYASPALGVPQATAEIIGAANPTVSPEEAHARGKRLVKTAAWLAGIGVAVYGATTLGEKYIAHETNPWDQNTPTNTQPAHTSAP